MTTAVTNSCSTPPLPLAGGGAAAPSQSPVQSPIQAPIQGGGMPAVAYGAPVDPAAQQAYAVQPVAVAPQPQLQPQAQATQGGGLVQPAPVTECGPQAVAAQPAAAIGAAPAPAAAPAPVAAPAAVAPAAGAPAVAAAPVAAPAAAAQPDAPAPTAIAGASGGGDIAPAAGTAAPGDMSAIIPALQQVITTLNSLISALQAQSVQGGGAPGGCTCSTPNAVADATAAGTVVGQAPAPTTPAPPAADPASAGKLNEAGLTSKGKELDAEQRRLTEIVLQQGKKMGASEKVLKAAVATMIVESTIHNYNHGDRDSQGLFQQRPSQGWGSVDQVRDPVHAATKFYERAMNVDAAKPQISMGDMSQKVQVSAFPDRYAQHEAEAAKIVAAFNA
jgi:hypothetical protein